MGMPAALIAVVGIAFFSAGASPPPALTVAEEGDSIWIATATRPSSATASMAFPSSRTSRSGTPPPASRSCATPPTTTCTTTR